MKTWICLLTLLAASTPSWGQTPLTAAGDDLYDTGWSSAGVFQANSNLQDGHYILVSITPNAIPPSVPSLPSPSYGVTNAEVTSGGWVQTNSATGSINGSGQTVGANWISFSPSTDIQTNTMNVFDYRLSLTNIPVGSVVTITGNFGGDDGLSIFADGGSTVLFTNPNWGTSAARSFTFTANGSDYLDFDVTNDNNSGGYTGLYVNDLAGSFTAVPEPREWATWILLSLAALVTIRKLRSSELRSA